MNTKEIMPNFKRKETSSIGDNLSKILRLLGLGGIVTTWEAMREISAEAKKGA